MRSAAGLCGSRCMSRDCGGPLLKTCRARSRASAFAEPHGAPNIFCSRSTPERCCCTLECPAACVCCPLKPLVSPTIISISCSTSGQSLRFNDPRRFGSLHYVTSEPAGRAPAARAKLAPEPFDSGVSTPTISSRRSRAAARVVHQAAVDEQPSGCRRRQHLRERSAVSRAHPPAAPERAACQTGSKRPVWCALMRTVLKAAIRVGGTTLRDYVGADGEAGYFRQKLFVYERAGEACRVCRTTVIGIVQSGPAFELLSARPARSSTSKDCDEAPSSKHLARRRTPVMKRLLVAAVGPYRHAAARIGVHAVSKPSRAPSRISSCTPMPRTSILRRFVSESCGEGRFSGHPRSVLARAQAHAAARGRLFALRRSSRCKRPCEENARAASCRSIAMRLHEGIDLMTKSSHASPQVRGIGRWTVEMMLMFQLAPARHSAGRRFRRAQRLSVSHTVCARCRRRSALAACSVNAGARIAPRRHGTCGARWN
jgi:hypothetical protein